MLLLSLLLCTAAHAADKFTVGHCEKMLEGGMIEFEIKLVDDAGNELATYSALLNKSRTFLQEGDMNVQIKEQGYGRELARLVMEKYPTVVRLESELHGDNLDKFIENYEELWNVKKALVTTMFYKIWARQGLTNIRILDHQAFESLRVALNKPMADRRR